MEQDLSEVEQTPIFYNDLEIIEDGRLRVALDQIRALRTLPPEERREQISLISKNLERSNASDKIEGFLESVEGCIRQFSGDPSRLISLFEKILTSYEESPSKTQLAVQRYVLDKQIALNPSPPPFDWGIVDMLLMQIEHLFGETAMFTKEMMESIMLTVISVCGEGLFLLDLLNQMLLLAIGEDISIVRKRIAALSKASLAQITILSNELIDIHNKYLQQRTNRQTPQVPDTPAELENTTQSSSER